MFDTALKLSEVFTVTNGRLSARFSYNTNCRNSSNNKGKLIYRKVSR